MRRGTITALAAYLMALTLNHSLVRVRGRSMEPTYREGDLLLTVPSHPALSPTLRSGRVVVVEDPTAAGHLVVKRIRRIGPAGIDVRGDAPMHSTDSRVWGPLGPAAVRRIVVTRVGARHRSPRGTD